VAIDKARAMRTAERQRVWNDDSGLRF
jgi:hypothetical protein